MGPMKVAVVGAPSYFERRRPPRCLEGLFLYYPAHRQVPAALRAFIDMIRAPKSAQSMRSLKNPFFTD
jgi:DNA-binding transcriptional LysR family regulator